MAETVYLNYTREELDAQYTNVGKPGAAEAQQAANARAEHNVATLSPERGIAYGAHPGATFDLYRAGPGAPAMIYVHGGQWQKGSTVQGAIAADTCLAQGVTLVAAGFAQIPDIRLPEMVDQIVALIRHVRDNAEVYGIDANRLCVAGHSSGGHLAAAALVRLANENDAVGIACGYLLSGNYDLRPLMLSYRADYLQLSDAETAALSPLLALDKPLPPLMLNVGGAESEEFQRQLQTFVDALDGKSQAETRILPGRNHFSASDDICDATSPAWVFLRRHLDLEAAAAAQ